MMSSNPFNPSNHVLVGHHPPYLLLCEECYCRDSVEIVDPIVKNAVADYTKMYKTQ